MKKFSDSSLLAGILILAAFLRLYGINWDQGFHLHPDERFLTMVGNAMRIPLNLLTYFDQATSTLNPINVGYPFFVYGTFPVVLNKILAVLLGTDNYNGFTLQGRLLSGLFDTFTVYLIYKTVQLIEKQYSLPISLKFLASFFYALAVLPIQLSYFFAVDTFLNFFVFESFFFILRYSFYKNKADLIFSAIFLGFAFASKASAIFVIPLLAYFLLKTTLTQKNKIISLAVVCLIFFSSFYVTLRIANPYYFATNNFLNINPSHAFVQSIKTLKSLEGKDIWYPPAVQWINKTPILFSLTNLAIFGVGVPYFLFTVIGIFSIWKKRETDLVVISLWVAAFFLYQSTQFVKTMRYFIILYPFLAILASIGFAAFTKRLHMITKVILLLTIIVWPLFFFSIYMHEHSRTNASKWIYQNLENNSILLGEHWDDALPLQIQETYGKNFTTLSLPVFDEDTPAKWVKINTLLAQGDYLILSSNRGWGSITTAPEKYPLMSKFYQDLFDGKLRYKKIKEFTSYPSLRYLGTSIDFPDDWAEEVFTVYDHPKVMIFKRAQN